MSKADFAPTKTKLTIGSLDDTGLTVSAQYNPKELQVDRNVPWAKPPATNKSNNKGKGGGGGGADGGIRMEFTGAEGRAMQVELLFDGYEVGGGTVLQSITDLETMATVRSSDPNAKSDLRRPHHCVVKWGDRGLPSFKCVIQSLSVKYQAFSEDGLPLRATATVKLAEADTVQLGKPQ